MPLKVFVSCTTDMGAHPVGGELTYWRAAITGAEAVAGCRADGMTAFSASPPPPASVCRERVLASDVLVVIAGFSYGSLVPDLEATSFVRLEYDAARNAGKPILGFLLDESARSDFPDAGKSEAATRDAQLQEEFRKELQAAHLVARVGSPMALREAVSQALNGHISSNPSPARESPHDLLRGLDEGIRRFNQCIAVNDRVGAYHSFFLRPNKRQSPNNLLDFVFNRCDQHLELVEKFFPEGTKRDPRGLDPGQKAQVLNALARAYKNTGRLRDAIDTFRRQLSAEVPQPGTGVLTLQNYMNALRLAGNLREATAVGEQLWTLSRNEPPRSIGYALYWNGIVHAVRGSTEDAEMLLRQAEVVFEEIATDDDSRGLGRTYTHLAQFELWAGNARFARQLASRAHRLASRHDEVREHIFTSRVLGQAALMDGDDTVGHRWLSKALHEANAPGVGYDEETIAATIGLAELDRRTRQFGRSENKLREAEARAKEGNYRLLLADALAALARVIRDAGRGTQATALAREAQEVAWCDGPPFTYGPGMRAAASLLIELGAEPAQFEPHADVGPTSHQSVSIVVDERWHETAHWRRRFSEFMRIITGPYRYAPTKFIRLLQEDWSEVERIVRGVPIAVPPQHVEIHLTEPCNLRCVFCRGGSREAPSKKPELPLATASLLLRDIRDANPGAFVRFSGLVGEPLRHSRIGEVLRIASDDLKLKWGITTNGVLMKPPVADALLKAEYVHVSLDAGSNETYQRLKAGPANAFDTVIANVDALIRKRDQKRRMPSVVVSIVLQKENVEELEGLARRLKVMKVDSVEIKMQHFDPQRCMSETQVREAYRVIERVKSLGDESFRVVVVQSLEQALAKVREGSERISFTRCFANELGLNTTISQDGSVQTCCQYYQATLGSQGSLNRGHRFREVWVDRRRSAVLSGDPSKKCTGCSPSDQFVNEFVDLLRRGYAREGESLLDWVKEQFHG